VGILLTFFLTNRYIIFYFNIVSSRSRQR